MIKQTTNQKIKPFTGNFENYRSKKIGFILLFVFCAFFSNFLKAQSVSLGTISISNSKTAAQQPVDVFCNGDKLTFSVSATATGFGCTPTLAYSYSYDYKNSTGTPLGSGSGNSFDITYNNRLVQQTYVVKYWVVASVAASSSCSAQTATSPVKTIEFTWTADQRNLQGLKFSKSNICLGDKINIELDGSNWDWYSGTSWHYTKISGSGITSTTPSWFENDIYPTATGNVTYTATGYTMNKCPITKSDFIVVNPPPALSISASKNPICLGDPVQLTASGGMNYTWTSSPGGGLATTTGSVVNATPNLLTGTTTKVYTVAGKSTTTSCTNTQSISIDVIDLPNPVFTVLYAQRTVTFVNSTGGYTGPAGPASIQYIWDYGDGSPPFITPSNANHTHTYTNAQNYTVVLTIRQITSGCTKQYQLIIDVDATPIANFSMPTSSCLKDDGGSSGTLNVVSFTNTSTSTPPGKEGTFNYVWDFGDGNSQSANYSATITHTYAADGIYTVKLTATNHTGRETNFITKNISIDPNPFINLFTVTGNCQGSSIDFQDQTHQYHSLPEKVEWDFDGNSSIDATYTSSNVPPTPAYKHYYWTFSSANSYTSKLKLTYTTTGCISTITKNITIDAKPTPTISLSSTTMCENTATPITYSTNSYAQYDWTLTPPSNTLRYSTVQSSYIPGTWVEVGNNQKLALKVKTSQNCWSDEVLSYIDIWAAPVANFTATTVCNINDNLTQFTNTSTGPQTTYFWEFGSGGSTSASTNPSFDYSNAGNYNVKLTVTESSHSCFADITQSITVKPNPTVDFTIGTTKCEGQAIDFTDISTLSGNTISSREWDWDNNSTYDYSTANAVSQNTFPSAGTYSVKLKSTASNGCYDTKVNSFTINPKPAVPTLSVPVNINNNTTLICAGESYTLNATPSSGYSYSWYFNGNYMGNGYASSSLSDVGNLPLPDSRPYTVRITNGNGCYNTSATTTIGVKRLNNSIIISNGNNVLCQGATATLSGSALTNTQTYTWKKDPYDALTQTYSGSYTTVGSNSKTHLVDNANEGRYKYLASYHITGSTNDCADESPTIDIINALPLSLTFSGVVNINVITPQVLTYVNNPFPTYTDFKWYRNGILESTSGALIVTKPGKYFLIATGSCGFEKSNEVEFKYDCNAVGYYGGYTGSQTFSTTTTITGLPTIMISGDWTINTGATLNLTNVNIVVSNCSKIIVTNGTLNISGCVITGCTQWNGLISSSSSSTININSSTISGAVVGVASVNGGKIYANQSQFDDNILHVGFGPSIPANPSSILFCNFGELNLNSAGCTHPSYPGYSYVNHPMMYFEDANGITVASNKLNTLNTNSANKIEGIQTKNCESMDISFNYDEGFLDRCVNIRQGNLMSVTNNTFGFSLTPPLSIYYSRLGWFKTGLLLVDAKGSNVERNLITNADQGIAFYQNTAVPVAVSSIVKNRMENCNWGLITATKENPALSVSPYQNSNTQKVYVQVNCNSFNYNSFGWIGTGKYDNQGSTGLASGNTFSSTANWNVCVADNSKTYFYNTASGAEDPYSGSNGPFIMDGITYNTTTQSFSNGSGIQNSCSNKRSSSATSSVSNIVEENNKLKMAAYPNPFGNKIELKVTGLVSQKSFTVRVFDVTGKMMIERVIELSDNESIFIDSEAWSTGIYAMQIMNEGKIVYAQKLIKAPN